MSNSRKGIFGFMKKKQANDVDNTVGNVSSEDGQGQRSRLSKRKMLSSGAAGLGVLAASFIAVGSVANWTDSGSVGTQLQAGTFWLEVSVDGGETWTGETTIDAFADLPNASAIEAWDPSDFADDWVNIRVPEDATHSAEVTFDLESDHENGWTVGLWDIETDFIAQGSWVLEPGEEYEFVTQISANEFLEPGATGDTVITFYAESIPN